MKIPVLGTIVEFVEKLASKWMDAKLEEANTRIEIAKIRAKAAAEVEVSKSQADIKWDMTQAEASKTSWKDEFWTLILAVPVFLAFIPGGDEFVRNGFQVLSEDVPDWYLYALGTAIAAAFGVRKLTGVIGTSTSRGRRE